MVTSGSVDAMFRESMQKKFGRGQVGLLPLFLKKLVDAGVLKDATAQSYRTAVRAVLVGADPEAAEPDLATDVRELDVNAWCETFAETQEGLSQATVATYQGRFANAVDLYRAWLSDPESVQDATPAVRDHLRLDLPQDNLRGAIERRIARIRNENVHSSSPASSVVADLIAHLALQETPSEEKPVPYPFPLSDGRSLAWLFLPNPLSRTDAERLSQFVLTLATDPPALATESAPDFRFLDADGNQVVGEVKRTQRSPHAPPLHEDDDDPVETELRLLIDPNVMRNHTSRKEQ